MNHAGKIGSGDAAGITDGHPVFHKRDRLPRFQKRVRLLISEETRLQLDVGAIVIRERFSPVEPIRVHTPGPDFLRGNFGVFGKMRGARIGVGIPDAHKVFAASMDEQRDGAIRLVSDDAEIFSLPIDRPSLYFGKSMCGGKTHRVLNPGVVPNLHAGIVPPIKTMAHLTAVAERGALLQNRRAGTQSQFHGPFHPINSVDIAHSNGCAAILVLRVRKVDGRHRDPVMGNGEIKFDSEGSPRPPITNPGFLDGWVRVEHGLPVDLVNAGVNMPAYVRQHGTFQVLIFEVDSAPLMFGRRVGYFVSQRVGIVEAPSRELIKRWIRVRRSLLVRRKIQDTFPYANLAINWDCGYQRDQDG